MMDLSWGAVWVFGAASCLAVWALPVFWAFSSVVACACVGPEVLWATWAKLHCQQANCHSKKRKFIKCHR